MVELYWPRNSTFLGDDQQYSGPGVHDVPDDREETFRERGWEDPPEPDEESDTENDESADEEDDASDDSDDEDSEDGLESLDGVGDGKASALREAEYHTLGDLRDASADELSEIEGVSQSLAQDIYEQVNPETET